jgi:hypothetical protein
MTGTGSFRNPITINKSGGTLTLSPLITLGTGCVLTWTAGTVDVVTNSNVLYCNGSSVTFATNGMTWNIIRIYDAGSVIGTTVTLTNNLQATSVSCWLFPVTFNGAGTFNIANFWCSNFLQTNYISLVSTKTYTITNSLIMLGKSDFPILIKSSSGGSAALLNMSGTNEILVYCNATDINSSGGNAIWTYNGTLSGTTNWFNTTVLSTIPRTISSVY